MMAHPLALQLRNLQSLVEIGVDKNTTIELPDDAVRAVPASLAQPRDGNVHGPSALPAAQVRCEACERLRAGRQALSPAKRAGRSSA
jgi:hypothetical protein